MGKGKCIDCGNVCDSRALRCRQCSNRAVPPRLGKSFTTESKEKISKSLMGHIPWNKGVKIGKKPHNWNGGRYIESGYVKIHCPEHLRANKKGYVCEHILICEKAIGRNLPEGVEPHHVNGDKSDNSPENLVLCQDRAYHTLLHMRTKALRACGNSDWRKCEYCKEWDSLDNLVIRERDSRNGRTHYHRECRNAYKITMKRKGAAGFQCKVLPFEH